MNLVVKDTLKKLGRKVFGAISTKNRVRLLRLMAETLAVDMVVRNGANGDIEGSLYDHGLFVHYLREGVWAGTTIRALKTFFNERGMGTYIDVGANIGLTLVPMAQTKGLTCIGIEPAPKQFALLQRNLIRNGVCDAVTLHNVAIFERTDIVALETSASNHGDNRLQLAQQSGRMKSDKQSSQTVMVNAIKIDDLIPSLTVRRPLAIKIDIQGSEPYLFSGGAKLLSLTDLLITEFWPCGMMRLNHDVDDFLKMLPLFFEYGAILEVNAKPMPYEWMGIDKIVGRLRARCDDIGTGYFDVALAKKPMSALSSKRVSV